MQNAPKSAKKKKKATWFNLNIAFHSFSLQRKEQASG
jgi:hypothetical protein